MQTKKPVMLKITGTDAPDIPERLVSLLNAGGLVVIPTDTVYGVAAHPGIPEAVNRLYSAKGRDRDKAVPLLVSDAGVLEKMGVVLSDTGQKLAKAFWPGPLTLVARAGGVQEGFRVPDLRWVRMLLRTAGGALRASSANRSGEEPAVSAEEAMGSIGRSVDAVVDGGTCAARVPSTVVRVDGTRVSVLREGALSAEDLERALARAGDVVQ
ncbi:MAG: L-threonylcarbamoyladenylate synthase [Kiritimatiellia bacterium]